MVLEADENKFLEKVIVEKTPDFVSKVKRVPIYDFYINEIKTNGGYAGMISAGTLEDNVSVSDVVYLLPVSSSVGSQKILVRVVDPDDGRLVNGVITLHKGDTFVSTASTYTPGGELRFTENGRLQFYHTSSFTVGSSFSNCPMILLNNGVYYVVLADFQELTALLGTAPEFLPVDFIPIRIMLRWIITLLSGTMIFQNLSVYLEILLMFIGTQM